MNNDRERLLGDILAEPGGSGERRDALLNRTLRRVKRRRAVRRVRWAGSVLVPILGLLLWRVYLPPRPEASSRRVPYVLVRTEPLPASALILTQAFARSGLVVSSPTPAVATITTRPEQPGYREIGDTTLLALAGTNGAVLIRLAPHSAELVFASSTTATHNY